MDNLVELQQIEDEISETLAARRMLEKEGIELTSELEKIQEVVDKLTADLEVAEKGKREFQEVFAQGQEKIKKSEKKLPEIRTPKEYMAVMKEIDAAKKSNHEIMEKIKLKEEEIATVSREKGEGENALQEVQAKLEERNAEISPKMAEYDQDLSAKTESRETLLNNLPSSLKRRYQILIDQRGGVAVVEAKSGACLGCNMRLPPQFFNSLFSSEDIQCCPHCNRFLFVKAEENG
jgi:predicted  nucleic acid-binding Zn-ribbon protein